MLNDNERKKFETIEKLVNGSITRKEASIDLDLSLKQIDRLKNIYYSEGECGFTHKNRGKENSDKIDKDIIEELENLYLDEYYDYNFQAFYDVLLENKKYKDKYDISYSFLYKAFLGDDIISPIAHKGTIKLYNEKMNNAINKKENSKKEQILQKFSLQSYQ